MPDFVRITCSTKLARRLTRIKSCSRRLFYPLQFSSSAASHQRDGIQARPRRTTSAKAREDNTTELVSHQTACCRVAGAGAGRSFSCQRCGSPNIRIFHLSFQTPLPGTLDLLPAPTDPPKIAADSKAVRRAGLPSGATVLCTPRVGGGLHKSRTREGAGGGGDDGDDMMAHEARGGSGWRKGWRYRGDTTSSAGPDRVDDFGGVASGEGMLIPASIF